MRADGCCSRWASTQSKSSDATEPMFVMRSGRNVISKLLVAATVRTPRPCQIDSCLRRWRIEPPVHPRSSASRRLPAGPAAHRFIEILRV